MQASSSDTQDKDYIKTIGELAGKCNMSIELEEIARLATNKQFGASELSAIEALLSYCVSKNQDSIATKRLDQSRLPLREPKTFENFDFSRVRGAGSETLEKLETLTHLYARKNIAFIGPSGVGKSHLSQAYGRKCCEQGFSTLWLKANELRDKLAKALAKRAPARTVKALVNPSCLIIDEIGRCTFDQECTNLFFDIIDRRYEKDVPNTLILTSNIPASNWGQFFTGDDTLFCTLDRIFDRASVFLMNGDSFRGSQCETYSVETKSSVAKANQ